jgi:hypothetical protein
LRCEADAKTPLDERGEVRTSAVSYGNFTLGALWRERRSPPTDCDLMRSDARWRFGAARSG